MSHVYSGKQNLAQQRRLASQTQKHTVKVQKDIKAKREALKNVSTMVKGGMDTKTAFLMDTLMRTVLIPESKTVKPQLQRVLLTDLLSKEVLTFFKQIQKDADGKYPLATAVLNEGRHMASEHLKQMKEVPDNIKEAITIAATVAAVSKLFSEFGVYIELNKKIASVLPENETLQKNLQKAFVKVFEESHGSSKKRYLKACKAFPKLVLEIYSDVLDQKTLKKLREALKATKQSVEKLARGSYEQQYQALMLKPTTNEKSSNSVSLSGLGSFFVSIAKPLFVLSALPVILGQITPRDYGNQAKDDFNSALAPKVEQMNLNISKVTTGIETAYSTITSSTGFSTTPSEASVALTSARSTVAQAWDAFNDIAVDVVKGINDRAQGVTDSLLTLYSSTESNGLVKKLQVARDSILSAIDDAVTEGAVLGTFKSDVKQDFDTAISTFNTFLTGSLPKLNSTQVFNTIFDVFNATSIHSFQSQSTIFSSLSTPLSFNGDINKLNELRGIWLGVASGEVSPKDAWVSFKSQFPLLAASIQTTFETVAREGGSINDALAIVIDNLSQNIDGQRTANKESALNGTIYLVASLVVTAIGQLVRYCCVTKKTDEMLDKVDAQLGEVILQATAHESKFQTGLGAVFLFLKDQKGFSYDDVQTKVFKAVDELVMSGESKDDGINALKKDVFKATGLEDVTQEQAVSRLKAMTTPLVLSKDGLKALLAKMGLNVGEIHSFDAALPLVKELRDQDYGRCSRAFTCISSSKKALAHKDKKALEDLAQRNFDNQTRSSLQENSYSSGDLIMVNFLNPKTRVTTQVFYRLE